MEPIGADIHVRLCEFCRRTFRGVDTRRSIRRHLRMGRCSGAGVRRVQETLPTEEEIEPGLAVPAIPGPEVMEETGSTDALRRPLSDLAPPEDTDWGRIFDESTVPDLVSLASGPD